MVKIRLPFRTSSRTISSCRAIEIGGSAIRIGSLRRRGRGYRLIDYRSVALPREGGAPATPEAVREALRTLTRGMRIREEAIVSALPIHQVFIRALEVPFTKVAQIRQVIASEAELHVPFPLEEVVIDFWPVEELPEGRTRVMMAAVKKTVLEEHLRLLAEVGFNPDRVNLGILGLARTGLDSPQVETEEPTLLLDLGTAYTGVAFLFEGRVVFVRSISWGVKNLLAAGSPGEREALLTTLGNELLRTMAAAAPSLGGRALATLLLAGTGSQEPALVELLAQRTGLVPQVLEPLAGLRRRRSLEDPLAAAAVLGLARSEIVSTSDRVNFRRDEFAYSGAWQRIRRRLLLTGVLAAGVLALAAYGLFWKISLEERRIENLDRRIQRIARLILADAAEPASGEELPAMENELRRVEEELKYYRELVSVSALDLLREISTRIPDSLRVQAVVMDIDDKRVLFRGRTNNYRSVELIRNALALSPYFEGTKIRETRDSKTLLKGGELVTVEFEYQIPLAPRP